LKNSKAYATTPRFLTSCFKKDGEAKGLAEKLQLRKNRQYQPEVDKNETPNSKL
jgi:hypothetical protein